jgi:rSAM/selenodomain-associated transferase 2
MGHRNNRPTLSIVIPAHNEEATIEELLRQLTECGAEEIIVVDGTSTDRTPEVARGYAKVLRSARCRAVQMNAGVRAASGELLLFLHADVRLSAGALEAIQGAMQDRTLVGGNLDIRYEGSDLIAAVFTKITRWRRRWGIFYGDSGIFCRRSIFEALGGFRPWPILEDYDMARRLWKAGRLALLDEPIWVSPRRWKNGGLFATLWTWFWIQGLYLAGVSPFRLARFYRHVR